MEPWSQIYSEGPILLTHPIQISMAYGFINYDLCMVPYVPYSTYFNKNKTIEISQKIRYVLRSGLWISQYVVNLWIRWISRKKFLGFQLILGIWRQRKYHRILFFFVVCLYLLPAGLLGKMHEKPLDKTKKFAQRIALNFGPKMQTSSYKRNSRFSGVTPWFPKSKISVITIHNTNHHQHPCENKLYRNPL